MGCVQEQYHFVYKVIDEHVNRIESNPPVHSSTQDESPDLSSHLSPRRTHTSAKSVPYWHKWVSPDELPCRDVKRPCTPTRSLPRRTRDGSSRTPCVQKRRKSREMEIRESKKVKREPRKTEPYVETEPRPRSVSPCYNLPASKPTYTPPTRRRTKCRTSATQSPKDDRPVSRGESRLSIT